VRCFGAAEPSPIGHGAPSPLCTTIKARVPSPSLPLLDCCAAGTPSVPIYFVALTPPRRLPVDSFSAPFAPASYRLLRQSPPSIHFNDDLSPPSILRRPTPLRWPPVLIRRPLGHTFLVSGLVLAVASMTCLVISVAGCLLVGRP
jgi:hypothetical protein